MQRGTVLVFFNALSPSQAIQCTVNLEGMANGPHLEILTRVALMSGSHLLPSSRPVPGSCGGEGAHLLRLGQVGFSSLLSEQRGNAGMPEPV